ncbi:hypothetical protein [Dapis sp. BLCC M229]|uniref:hypothetical protein n=1 Tax=Dapis sp. BLCC M229 TaxID=3400188 RepID=UPI003CF04C26
MKTFLEIAVIVTPNQNCIFQYLNSDRYSNIDLEIESFLATSRRKLIKAPKISKIGNA